MLDVAVCSTMRAMAVPVVSLPALKDLAVLLAETRNGKAAPLQGDARVTSRDHHQGDRHAAPPVFAPSAEATARPLHQKPNTGVARALPDQVQRTLASLMTRLLLAHTGEAGTKPRRDYDEH